MAIVRDAVFAASILTERDCSAAVHLLHRQARRSLTQEKRTGIIRACRERKGLIVRRNDNGSPVGAAIYRPGPQSDALLQDCILLSDLAVEQRYARCGVGTFLLEAVTCLSVIAFDRPEKIIVAAISNGPKCVPFLEHSGVILYDDIQIQSAAEAWVRPVDMQLSKEKKRDGLQHLGHTIGFIRWDSVRNMASRVHAAADSGWEHPNSKNRFLLVEPDPIRSLVMQQLQHLAMRDGNSANLLRKLSLLDDKDGDDRFSFKKNN